MAMNPQTSELITFLASRNVFDGVLHEPRIKAQCFDFTSGQVATLASDDATFVNGEQYPVRITHLVAAIRNQGPGQSDAVNDPRQIQRIGLRMRSHDTFYMNDQFVLAPLWHNQPIAAADPISQSLSSWTYRFGKKKVGFFMGADDSLDVKVALEYPIDPNTEQSLAVWATFHGVGAISRRPKQLTGYYNFTVTDGINARSLGANSTLVNDGTEPLEITEMTLHTQAPLGTASSNPVGDISRIRVSVQQSGNGTNQRWTTTPASAMTPGGFLMNNTIPATLWGLTTGRSVVHELPKGDDDYPGWLWYPGQSMTIEVQPLSGVSCAVYVGLAGHIVVK